MVAINNTNAGAAEKSAKSGTQGRTEVIINSMRERMKIIERSSRDVFDLVR